MFVYTSAFVEILAKQAQAQWFEDKFEITPHIFTSGIVRLETMMVLTRFNLGAPARNQNAFDALLHVAGIEVLAIDDVVGRIAVAAFEKFGKGSGHGAALNLSDCMSYAVAKHHKLAILCKGDDFSRTDVEVVKPQS